SHVATLAARGTASARHRAHRGRGRPPSAPWSSAARGGSAVWSPSECWPCGCARCGGRVAARGESAVSPPRVSRPFRSVRRAPRGDARFRRTRHRGGGGRGARRAGSKAGGWGARHTFGAPGARGSTIYRRHSGLGCPSARPLPRAARRPPGAPPRRSPRMPVRPDLRDVAIVAPVAPGKTPMVDARPWRSGAFGDHQHVDERAMDSGDLEREKGITILAKNTTVRYAGPAAAAHG